MGHVDHSQNVDFQNSERMTGEQIRIRKTDFSGTGVRTVNHMSQSNAALQMCGKSRLTRCVINNVHLLRRRGHTISRDDFCSDLFYIPSQIPQEDNASFLSEQFRGGTSSSTGTSDTQRGVSSEFLILELAPAKPFLYAGVLATV